MEILVYASPSIVSFLRVSYLSKAHTFSFQIDQKGAKIFNFQDLQLYSG